MRWGLLGVFVVACSGRSTTVDAPEASCTAAPGPASGQGTYYAADGTGNCSFDASPNDRMVAAMNAADYDHASSCGACLAVIGPNGSVTVRIVDQCPACKHGDLDLSQQAFAKIAPLSAGRVAITWQEVPCDVTGPIEYRFKEGSNASWVAIQVRDHRYRIAKLEAQDATGTWTPIARADYNYFVVPAGLGPGPYMLRVTDTRGHSLDDMLPLAVAQVEDGFSQFPTCGDGFK